MAIGKRLDRFLLGSVGWSWVSGSAAFVVCLAFTPQIALFAGAWFTAILICKDVGELFATGQIAALNSAGISMRRIAVPIVLAAAVLSIAWLCVLVGTQFVMTRSLDALTITTLALEGWSCPLFATLAISVASKMRWREPWAAMFLILFVYIAATAIARGVAGMHPVFFLEYLLVQQLATAIAAVIGLRMSERL